MDNGVDNVEDKTFELLEKLYSEFSDFRKETNARLVKVEGHITLIENGHGKKLDALFDGYKQSYEKLEKHDKRFDDIETKLDNLSLEVSRHDSKLEVLEGGRKK